MSSIGTFTFINMEGPQLGKKARTVAVNNRVGVDGVAFRLEALKSGQQTKYTLEGFAWLSDANMAVDDYTALRGTLVTVIDDAGRQTDNVLVVDVIPETPRERFNSSPEGINYTVKAAWILQPTE